MRDGQKSLAELCEQARQRREASGLTLDEISESTKIHRRFLEAIEEGDLERLPGLVYSKGFIKNYLTAVGAEDLFPEFEGLVERVPGPVQTESLINYMPPQKGFQKTSRWWLYGILFMIIGVSLFVVWQQRENLVVRRERPVVTESPVVSEDEPSERDVAEADLPQAVEIAGEGMQEGPEESGDIPAVAPVGDAQPEASGDEDLAWLPGTEGRETPRAADVVREHKLVIRASGACWIRVTRNGDITYQGTLQNGDVREVVVDSPTRVRYGNAGAVRHSWNGNDLGAVGGGGQVITIEYLPDGSRNRL